MLTIIVDELREMIVLSGAADVSVDTAAVPIKLDAEVARTLEVASATLSDVAAIADVLANKNCLGS